MLVKTTTTVTFYDEMGDLLVSINRNEKVEVGGNPRLLLVDKALPTVVRNAETVLVNACRALDRATSTELHRKEKAND